MANFALYFNELLKFEGGYIDHPKDKGGPTNLGVTLQTWIKNGYDVDLDGDIDKFDLKLINRADAEKIAKTLYWDKISGDQIKSQSVAEIIFDWAYNSGVKTASKKVQQALGIVPSGIIDPVTICAINAQPAKSLFELLKIRREKFYKDIVFYNPSQRVFLNGWLNRLEKIKFKS